MTQAFFSVAFAFAVATLVSSCSDSAGKSESNSDGALRSKSDEQTASTIAAEVDTIGEIPAKVADLTKVTDLSSLIDPKLAADKFQGMLPGLDVSQLQEVGAKLVGSIQAESGLLDGLKKQFSGSSVAGLSALAGSGDLKESLESKTSLLSTLKEKLGSIVKSLQAKGADTSAFTKWIEG